MRAYVIEHINPPMRLIVVESRFGGYSFHLEEAAQLVDALNSALQRASDPAPLPEAEPNPVQYRPKMKAAGGNSEELNAILADLGI